MNEFNYEQQLAAAKEAAQKLKSELEELILGKRMHALRCACGTCSQAESEARRIVPGGQEKRYEGQIGRWYQWTIDMGGFLMGLSTFLPVDQIEVMFGKAFKSIDVERLELECYKRSSDGTQNSFPF